uniref:Leucine rich repeats and calponin homology domain containing 1 n=1 Tax=Gorilla gorilla gorilla TaxID=9595 RepID=A0A2I2ZJL6_GORGO
MATPGSEPQPFVPALSVATLHPLHHPHHHHHHQQHHGGTGAPGGASGGGGGSGGFNLPLNRGLERALEEAANSGGLNLSARKLKEFPRTAVPGHDLSDTVQADLSKNRLVEVPMELCHFVSLEILNLYHNCIRVIPEAIVNLQMLTYLNLSRNQLSTLPACLCGLPLKVLIASNNKLGSLPEEIGQLKQLMELDVSCNEITALPQQIGQLKSLRELNVRRNYLKVLPQGEFHQEFQPEASLLGDSTNSGEERDQFTDRADGLHSEFMNYKARAEDCEELLRIEEDVHWQTEGIISSSKDQDMDIAMIEQLREAVDLLQDPNGLSTDITERSVLNLYPMGSAEALELQDSALNGQIQLETSLVCEVQSDLTLQSNGSQYSPNEVRENSPAVSPTTNSTAPFGLKPRSDPALILPPISFNTLTQAQTWDSSSYSVPSEGDSDNVFLRPQRNLESIDPQFTIRRKMEQMREEKELVEQLRESIEMRLKVSLHEDLGAALMDGVVLCHLVNHIRPRSVASIHVPSPAVPKLSMAKCRRNVENFLEACRKLGVPEADLCSPCDILQLDFRHIRKTVDTLLALGEKAPPPTSALRSRDLIGFCLVHILFIVLVYITYHWNALSA